jgi:hypothetical protein
MFNLGTFANNRKPSTLSISDVYNKILNRIDEVFGIMSE